MAYEIVSALIQVVPTAALALAAFRGLDSWREQLQGARAVERAEACLDAVHVVAGLVRAARSWPIRDTEEATALPDSKRDTWSRGREEALERAWASWKTFAAAYRRAGFFMTMPKVDAAKEIAEVLTKLSSLSHIIADYERLEGDQTAWGPQFRGKLVGFRNEFMGFKPDGPEWDPDNELEVRLSNAVAAVDDALMPITGARK